jgi:hypothetical protein
MRLLIGAALSGSFLAAIETKEVKAVVGHNPSLCPYLRSQFLRPGANIFVPWRFRPMWQIKYGAAFVAIAHEAAP